MSEEKAVEIRENLLECTRSNAHSLSSSSSSFSLSTPTSLSLSSFPPLKPPIPNRLSTVFSQLAEAGIEVRAHDCIGHGTSVSDEGERGFVPRYSYLVDDLRAAAARAAGELPGVPLFLGGHSMGGLIAALAALGGSEGEEEKNKPSPSSSSSASAAATTPTSPSPSSPPPPLPRLAGLLLWSPALDVEWTPILRAQAPIGGLLSLLLPRARVVPAVDPKHLCRDQTVVAAYRSDPLNFVGNVRARTANELLRGFRAVAPLAGSSRCRRWSSLATQTRSRRCPPPKNSSRRRAGARQNLTPTSSSSPGLTTSSSSGRTRRRRSGWWWSG